MLKRLFIKNFTVFAEAEFEFGPGLNVVVGTNGTGKSHVLKLGYAVLKGLVGRLIESTAHDTSDATNKLSGTLSQRIYDSFLGNVLLEIFRPAPMQLGELVRRGREDNEASVNFEVYDERIDFGSFTFDQSHAKESPLVHLKPSPLAITSKEVGAMKRKILHPVFIPAKEVLTFSWMLPASGQVILPLDETYLDLLTQLSRLPLRQPESTVLVALDKLTKLLGGKVEEEGGRYYLTAPREKRMEMNMVAEGLRKFGTLQKLLSNGSLTPKATLFWDEPEANLNPALLKKLAAVLAELAQQGFQIILATHSLFLLKQFHILSRQKDTQPLPIRYFGLNASPGESTRVTMKEDFELLPDIVALDEEIDQADKLTIVFSQDDANNK
ncbi:AAA family ATPase [Hymenobacter sp. HD11105]